MKHTNKLIMPMLATGLAFGATACGSSETAATTAAVTEATTVVATEAVTEAETTEAVEEQKPVLLAVSFGTSYNDTRAVTIDAIEQKLADAYPEYEVRNAYTAQIVIDILEERENMEIDNVEEAMERLVADGVKEVIVQPTHVMPGFEYDDICKEVSEYADKFDTLEIGDPLLTSDRDYDALVDILKEETAEYNQEGTAVVFMGHGTHHEANETYTRLQKRLHAKGLTNYFIGTVEGAPLVNEVIASIKETDAKKVVLLPLMIVAGDHANNDMAGDEEDSWKTAFTAAGYKVECVLSGLGQYEGVQNQIIEHAGKAMEGQKPVMLVTSFGTSYNDTRALTIDAVEDKLAETFPEYETRRAFTAQIVIDILNDRDGHKIQNVTQAMESLVAEGVKDVVVVPTHIMPGFEYDDVCKEVAEFEGKFDSLKISNPIVTEDADYDLLVDALLAETAAYEAEDTAIVFMGHGTHHEANATYANLEAKLHEAGKINYFIGTVEGSPLIDEVVKNVQATEAKKVVLMPLMIVAGDHANNDMAGDEEDSWKTAFTAAGYKVECVLKGIGEYSGVQKILTDHVAAAIAK